MTSRIAASGALLPWAFLVLAAAPLEARGEVLASELVPVQVHFEEPGERAFAERLLAAVEASWAFQVDELGLPPPPPDRGHLGSDDLDVLVRQNPYGASCSEGGPAEDRPDGAWSYLVFDPTLPAFVIPLVVSHELHHAVQAGMQASGNNIMEAGAVYVSNVDRRGEGWMLSYFLGFNEFQAHPERSLDWQGRLGDFYPYGGALFLIFLEQAYGDGRPGTVYKRIWDVLARPGPTRYFEALTEVVDVEEAYRTFARWRYFAGPEDDGFHFEDLAFWGGRDASEQIASVALWQDLSRLDLPLEGLEPEAGPMPYGATYLRIDLAGLEPAERVVVELSGEAAVRWSVEAMLVARGARSEETSVRADSEGRATLDLAAGGWERLVVALVNLGPEEYEPEGPGWVPAHLSVSLSVSEPAEDGGPVDGGDADLDAGGDGGVDGGGDGGPGRAGEGGCSCRAAPPSPSPWAAALLALLGRRRASRGQTPASAPPARAVPRRGAGRPQGGKSSGRSPTETAKETSVRGTPSRT